MMRPQKLASSLPVPVAAICTPFADGAGSGSLPVSDPGGSEVLQCFRCRCYANPYFRWDMRHSVTLTCNMCGHQLSPSDEFLKDMDRSGKCVDEENHPELGFGSVDLRMPARHGSHRQAGPSTPAVCFLVEASPQAARGGLARAALRAIEELLGEPDGPMQRQMCLALFDGAVHFFAPTRTQRFRKVTMADLEDPYAPLSSEALYVSTSDELGRSMMIGLLQHLQQTLAAPEASTAPDEGRVAGGAGVRAALEALVHMGGGDLLVFHASTPSAGIGALQDAAVDKNETACCPWQAAFYQDTLQICTRGGVAVSSITGPLISAHVAETLQWLPRRTGGESLHLPSTSALPAPDLADHLRHWATRMNGSAYDCVFKLRCSRGVECTTLIAPWPAASSSSDQSAFEIARMSPDTTVTFVLSPEFEDEPEDEGFYMHREERRRQHFVQAVALYTNAAGERLLRVHTSAINIVTSVRLVYQGISVAPLMALLLKQAVTIALDRKPKAKYQPKEYLVEFCLQVLVAYYRHCHSSDGTSQDLVLNRKLSLFPLYILAARKFLYPLTNPTHDRAHADEILRKLLRMPVHSIMAALYPRLYALPAAEQEDAGLPSPLPTFLEYLLGGGEARAYLVTNGLGMWYHQADGGGARDPELWGEAQDLSRRLREASGPNPVWAPLSELPSIRHANSGHDGGAWKDKVFLSSLFVEDDGTTEIAYPAWVQALHRQVARMLEHAAAA